MSTTLPDTHSRALSDTQDGSATPAAPVRVDGVGLAMLALATALLLTLGAPTWGIWIGTALGPGSYDAFAPLVPLIVALMLWHRRDALRAVPKATDYRALPVFLLSVAMLVVGHVEWWIFVGSAGLLLGLWSGVWFLLGGRWIRAAAFPLLFLGCMAGLPGPIAQEATFGSQQLSTLLADRALHLLSFPTTLQGNMIRLDSFTLFVDLPCSGFKLLLTLLVISAALLWLSDGPPRRRLALFAFSLPLAIADNVARLVVLAVVGESFGAPAEKLIHDPSGLLMVGLGVAVLFLLARRVGCRRFAGLPLF